MEMLAVVMDGWMDGRLVARLSLLYCPKFKSGYS